MKDKVAGKVIKLKSYLLGLSESIIQAAVGCIQSKYEKETVAEKITQKLDLKWIPLVSDVIEINLFQSLSSLHCSEH